MRAPPDADAILAARAALAQADPALARVDGEIAPFAWRTRPDGYAGLVRMVLGQQVSVVSADATWARLEAACGGEVTPSALLALSDVELRGCGLSGQKTRYARAMADAELGGRIDLVGLPTLDDETALQALQSLLGVGRWTAEIYLMMAEGRLDAFPAGDIAVQEAMRWLDGLPARPREDEAYARAERWRPHRAVATHLLWSWYMAVKSGEAAHPLGDARGRRTVVGVGA